MRTFLAIPIPALPALRRLHRDLELLGGGLKVVPISQWHLTLKFLGDVDESLIPEMSNQLRALVVEVTKSELSLKGIGVFPNPRRPQILWVGVRPSPLLNDLAAQVDDVLEPFGVDRERREFHPHLTVVRINSRPPNAFFDLLETAHKREFGVFPWTEVQFMKSELAPQGARHTVLESFPLA